MIEKSIDRSFCSRLFPSIPDRANKGMMGRVLVVCGSYDPCGASMCGAAYFAARSAYLCGAGVVEIFTARENYSAVAALVPEAVFSLYGYDESADAVSERLALSVKRSDSVIIGCGLGKSALSRALVKAVLCEAECPLVIDADGLNILSEDESLWSCLNDEQGERTVITPHPGEMARLSGRSIGEILDSIPKSAQNFAIEKGIICLLKDHNTAVSDGNIVYINQSGNPGMATAGMGDALAGIIGALIARSEKGDGEDILSRVAASAYLHGLAGDLAADRCGQYSLTAGELLAEIPNAIGEIFSKK